MFWAHGHRLAVKQSFKVGPPHRRSLGAPGSPELLSTRHLDRGGEVSASGEACLVLACAFTGTPTLTHQP